MQIVLVKYYLNFNFQQCITEMRVTLFELSVLNCWLSMKSYYYVVCMQH